MVTIDKVYSMARAAQPGFKLIARDQSGAVMPIFGILAIGLTAFIGLAIDVGRWTSATDQTISAADAAVLAAGRALQTNGGDKQSAISIAQQVYHAAVAGRDASVTDAISFDVTGNGLSVQAIGNASINTKFMGILGVHKLSIFDENSTNRPTANISIGQNAGMNVEVAMMLDVSGSMCNNPGYDQPCKMGRKLDAMKEAASDLVNIVVWEKQSEYTSRISIVPFSGDVQPPAAFLDDAGNKAAPFVRSQTTIRNGRRRTTNYYFAPSKCLAERGGDAATSDIAPSSDHPLRIAYHKTNAQTDTTSSCAIHSDSEIMPMTYSKVALLDRIAALQGQGGTAGHVGTAWAYYMLSPKWNGKQNIVSKADAFGTKTTRKVAVLMTDGEYNYTYDSDAGPSSSSELGSGDGGAGSINSASSAAQAIAICTAMKNDGIEVYTVGFELGGNQTAINTLTNCATSPAMAYRANDGEELKKSFRDIALQISKLYLSN